MQRGIEGTGIEGRGGPQALSRKEGGTFLEERRQHTSRGQTGSMQPADGGRPF